jgi:hypothetical protein
MFKQVQQFFSGGTPATGNLNAAPLSLEGVSFSIYL